MVNSCGGHIVALALKAFFLTAYCRKLMVSGVRDYRFKGSGFRVQRLIAFTLKCLQFLALNGEP